MYESEHDSFLLIFLQCIITIPSVIVSCGGVQSGWGVESNFSLQIIFARRALEVDVQCLCVRKMACICILISETLLSISVGAISEQIVSFSLPVMNHVILFSNHVLLFSCPRRR